MSLLGECGVLFDDWAMIVHKRGILEHDYREMNRQMDHTHCFHESEY